MDCQSRKCDEKARKFCVEGDEFAAVLKYFDAVVSYNKSLCFAIAGSSEASRAFARRADVYLELKIYEKCLENVSLAKKLGGDVAELDEKCEQLMLEQIEANMSEEDPLKFFKLSRKAHPKIPFIASCLKPIDTWKYGRCIITNDSLKTGDIVAIEEPFFRMLNKSSRHSRCAGCMKSNLGSLIPCPSKCTTTMFCTQSCLESSWNRFHKYECGSLDQSLDNDNEYDIMIMKIVFESLNCCGSLEKLQALLGDSKLTATVFEFDLNDTKTKEKNLLKAVYSLKKGPTSDEDLSMAEWITDLPIFTSLCKTKSQREFLKSFVIKVMGIIDRNSYIFYCPALNSSYVNEEIGSGVFPFASLINHSCSPNLYRVFVDNKQVFVVKKPIEAGQQLFVGYQANFTFSSREDRQEFLLKDFQFKCSCEACTANFPLLDDLKKCDENFQPPPTSTETVEEAEEIFKKNCIFVEKSLKVLPFPCFEICSVMQNSFRQLQFIAGKKFLLEK